MKEGKELTPKEKVIEIEHLDLHSHTIGDDKIRELLRLFPEIRTEGGKLDFDRFKLALGGTVDVGKERYGLSWPGKAECFKTIQTQSLGTLRPAPSESMGWEMTGNVIVEGDNLEALKLLQKAYLAKVKLIYIDPPYNTGNDFIYPDNYTESLQTYLEYTGQVDSEGKKFGTNTDTDGRFHSKWLSMMYPRLYLAQNLLREDGFIAVSIDDAELSSLRAILNEIYGEENFLATLVYDRNRKNDAKFFSVGHDYIVVYAKDKLLLRERDTLLRAPKEGVEEVRAEFERLRKDSNDDWDSVETGLKAYYKTFAEDDPRKPLARFTKVDERGPYRTDGDPSWPGAGGPRYAVPHPITGKPCKIPSRGWVWSTYERMKEEIDKGNIIFGDDETKIPGIRRDLFERNDQVMRSVIFSYAQKASQDFAKLFDGKKVFDNPKSYLDMQRLIQYLSEPGDLILDFFAGSGTTAHGVLMANQEDEPPRHFILVQLPEPLGDKEEAERNARALGYRTIADICKDRVRRVVRELSAQAKGKLDASTTEKQDNGFRVYKLAESNLRPWDADRAKDASTLQSQLVEHVHHLMAGRSPEDILTEILLKSGFPLTTPVEQMDLANKRVYSAAGGELLICLDRNLTLESIRAIAERKPERVVLLDEGFSGNDQLKANAVQTFRTKGVTSFKTV